jgi:hypothetical protein
MTRECRDNRMKRKRQRAVGGISKGGKAISCNPLDIFLPHSCIPAFLY